MGLEYERAEKELTPGEKAHLEKTLFDILRADVYGAAKETPLEFAPVLSDLSRNQIYLKREDLQPVFSFKIRGAYNRMRVLTAGQRAKGVCACSAGNHAQGVAYAAKLLGISAKIFMPSMAPAIKVASVKRLGGEFQDVILGGENFDACYSACMKCIEEEGRVMIHPFDDPLVIAGQGTVGMEILKSLPQPDFVFIQSGGGGLSAGVSAYIKTLRPSTKVIIVEDEHAPGMTNSLKMGSIDVLGTVGSFSDGTAVRKVGEKTFEITKCTVDGAMLVSNDQICAAIKDCYVDCRVVLEPSGAQSIAGVKKYISETGVTGKTFVAICSGANMDFDRLRFVSERADVNEVLFGISVSDSMGELSKLAACIHPRKVTEFSCRAPPKRYSKIGVLVAFKSLSPEDAALVEVKLTENCGYNVVNLNANECAKMHLRRFAGGRAPLGPHEVLFRFRFPESPSAFTSFLDEMAQRWNVTILHYRSHSCDFARVLCGLEIPPNQKQEFQGWIKQRREAGWLIRDETDNPVCSLFLEDSENKDTAKAAAGHERIRTN